MITNSKVMNSEMVKVSLKCHQISTEAALLTVSICGFRPR